MEPSKNLTICIYFLTFFPHLIFFAVVIVRLVFLISRCTIFPFSFPVVLKIFYMLHSYFSLIFCLFIPPYVFLELCLLNREPSATSCRLIIFLILILLLILPLLKWFRPYFCSSLFVIAPIVPCTVVPERTHNFTSNHLVV